MSYKVSKSGEAFDLHELESDITIELNVAEKSARDLCRKLNLGSGFNGWTPPFFAAKFPLQTTQ